MTRLVRLFCLSMSLGLIPGAVAGQAPPTSSAGLLAMPVPGTVAGLTQAAGIERPVPRWRVMREVIRRVHVASPGARNPTAAAVTAYLFRTPVGPSSETVPMLLPVTAWKKVLGETVDLNRLAVLILSNRQASLLYHGLTALDRATLEFVAGHPQLLSQLNANAAAFSALSGGLRVDGQRVVVPGGPAADALWTSLLGVSPTEAETFIARLYAQDGGKVAYFFNALSALPAGTLRFSLFPSSPQANEGSRAARFKDLYAACSLQFLNLSPSTSPFHRPPGDGADVLLRVRIRPDGTLVGPAWASLWSVVFAAPDLPYEPALALKPTDSRSLTAAELVSMVCVTEFLARRDRTAAFLWGQRVFPNPDPAAMPDLLVALRGFMRHPALALTLERMGITDPALYARAMRTASRLSAVPDAETEIRLLKEFQAALAVLDRIRCEHTLDVETTSALVRSLVDLPLSKNGGAVATWIEKNLLPALRGVVNADAATADRVLLAAMAGHVASRATKPRVTWEGVSYRVDHGQARFARMVQARQRQRSTRLDDVLSFGHAVSALSDVTTVEAVEPALAALRQAAGAMTLSSQRVDGVEGDVVCQRAVNLALSIKSAQDLSKLATITAPLARLTHLALGDTLTSLAYLPVLGDPTGTASLTPDLWARHDFALEQVSVELHMRAPWKLPAQSFGMGSTWHVTGSLLGLDAALATLSLRRVSTDAMPARSTIDENVRQALAEAVVFSHPQDTTDAERGELVAAIARGKASVEQLARAPEGVDGVAAAVPLPAWRREALRWLLVHEPEELDRFFGLGELLALGRGAGGGPRFDAWGTSDVVWSGRLSLEYPEPGEWELFEGQHGLAPLAARLPDLALWTALALDEARLPASLTGDILAAATQDLIDEARLIHFDDWLSACRFVRERPRTRFDDYVAALTAGGPLVLERE